MVTSINVRVSEKEKDMCQKLANYLHTVGKIEDPNLSEAIRVCLHFTTKEIIKAIEAERTSG